MDITSKLAIKWQIGKFKYEFDWAIKRLLRNKADFSVLEGFLI